MIKPEVVEKKVTSSTILEEMIKSGVHIGHKSFKLHPRMKPYVYGVKKTIHIIDLEKTKEKLDQALSFIKEMSLAGKKILLVGTKVQASELVKNMAEECGLPYVSERWLGGTLTNFSEIRKRIKYFQELRDSLGSEVFEGYTKKEKARLEKQIRKLNIKFSGIESMDKLPNAVFVCHMKKDITAVKEACIKHIPVIAICDTNVDVSLVDYPIPGNDDAVSSIKYILDKVRKTILESQAQAKLSPEREKKSISEKAKIKQKTK